MPTIRFFAAARDAAGTTLWQCDGTTVQQALDCAAQTFGQPLAQLLPYCTVMVNEEQADRTTTIDAGSEIALLPPVSGGAGSRIHCGILTVSDRASAGTYVDKTGPALETLLQAAAISVAKRALVPDEQAAIESTLRDWIAASIDVIFTNGGTGLSARDVTPEATRAVVERELPGIAEAMRSAGRQKNPLADLSRQVAGTAGRTLVINLPGSPTAATECLEAVLPLVEHAVTILRGTKDAHAN
jgi:molybdopterin adenylyltransferase